MQRAAAAIELAIAGLSADESVMVLNNALRASLDDRAHQANLLRVAAGG